MKIVQRWKKNYKILPSNSTKTNCKSNFEEPPLIKLVQKRQSLILSLKIIQRWKKNYKSVQISRRQIVNQTISNFEESLFIKLIQKRQSLILSLKIVQRWKKNYKILPPHPNSTKKKLQIEPFRISNNLCLLN